MTTDELKGFGLTDEQCQQVENLHNGEISSLQGQIGEKDTMISGLNGQLSEANKKLEGYDPEWKTKAAQAQTDAEAKVNEYRFNAALEKAITDSKAKDAVSVKAHLNMDALKFADGKIIGLDDQLKKIKEEKSYLFETDSKLPYAAGHTGGNDGKPAGNKNEQTNAAFRAAFGK